MNNVLKLFLSIFVMLIVVLLLAPLGLYLYGVGFVKEHLQNPEIAYDAQTLASYRKWLGAIEESSYRRLNPYTLVGSVIHTALGKEESSFRNSDIVLYNSASRTRIRSTKEINVKGMGEWHLANASALVYVSRNWSIDQSISETLDNQFYGRETYGLVSAAKFYFGLDYGELDEGQLYALFLLPRSPERYDLWCALDRHLEFSGTLLELRGVEHTFSELNLLPNPSEESCDNESSRRRKQH